MLRRFLTVFLLVTLLLIPVFTSYGPTLSSAQATLDTYGQNFWGGVACGVAFGAVVVGGGALTAGTGGFGAALAVSAGLHVLAVCALV